MKNYTDDQIALRNHIRAENQKFEDTCNAHGFACWAVYTDDLDHWEDMGITTVAQYIDLMRKNDFSDQFKEEHGFRPNLRTYGFN